MVTMVKHEDVKYFLKLFKIFIYNTSVDTK